MGKQLTVPEKQLKDACQISGARWALWLERGGRDWYFGSQYGVNQARLKQLHSLIQEKTITTWLAGALTSGHPRWHALNDPTAKLGTTRIYVYPNPVSRRLLLAGADQLDRQGEGLFRLLSAYCDPGTAPENKLSPEEGAVPQWPLETDREASHDPQYALESMLEFLASQLPCEAAYIAVRSGEVFHVQAGWHCLPGFSGTDIRLLENLPLQRINATGEGLILTENTFETYGPLPKVMRKAARSWLGIPVLISRRVIGLVAFVSSKPAVFNSTHQQLATLRTGQLAYNIESAIVFNEVTRYLQQLAIWNELASTAALGSDTESSHPADEFARRVMLRLRRVFNSDWAAVLMLSPDGQTLHESGGGSQAAPPWVVPVNGSIMGLAVVTGRPQRVGNIQRVEQSYPLRPNLTSELAVPLKYRGQVIGVLVVVSQETNAFSSQDEQLLVVIASQLAGLFENARLNEETRERAHRLADSVRQLQAVRDTSLDLAGDLDLNTLLKRVIHRAQHLVDARGASLGLCNEQEQVVEIVVADAPWEMSPLTRIPLMAGVAGKIASLGEPVVVEDYQTWPGKLAHEGYANLHTVAGVPLKYRDQVIGTLTVMDDRPEKAFQIEDVRLLELLAPQAAISIRNAQLYQELETRIQAQKLAEARLIRSARLAAVGEMAAGVAHELNNPLTTVTGLVEIALDELPSEHPQKSDLELVLQEAHRARGVVRRLLDFSRPVDDQRLSTDVNELIQGTLPMFEHLAYISGVKLHTDLDPGLPWISLDPNQIKQVLINLIHNALQALPQGGSLRLSTSRQQRQAPSRITRASQTGTQSIPEWVVITVSDDGEGIPPEIVERIFEPFFTTRPAGKGTGLGLSVSYGIVTSHGGWIEVDSQPGKGSQFRIYLPASA